MAVSHVVSMLEKNIKEEDIRASYDNGELKITFPKEVEKVPEKKTIMIE